MFPPVLDGAVSAVRWGSRDLRLGAVVVEELFHTDSGSSPLHHTHYELLPLQRFAKARRHCHLCARGELALSPTPTDMHQRTGRLEVTPTPDDQDRAPVYDDSGLCLLPAFRGAVYRVVFGDV